MLTTYLADGRHVTHTAEHLAQCAVLPNRERQFRTHCLVEADINLENPRLLQIVDRRTLSHLIFVISNLSQTAGHTKLSPQPRHGCAVAELAVAAGND